MKLKNLIACFFLGFAAVSCIQDEAPNSEADIESCTVAGNALSRTPIIENNEIRLNVKPGTDISKLKLEFTLTPGASIIPANGTEQDFTNQKNVPVTYKVTSEDGKWTKEYTVKVFIYTINTNYSFKNHRLHKNESGIDDYFVFYELNDDGDEIMTWASGNEGFAYTGVQATPLEYPTTTNPNGWIGDCLKLQTKHTGTLGEALGMPLAAGNLFTGSFKIDLKDILNATKFGVQFTHIPTFLKGQYKFKSGETFYILVDKGGKQVLEAVPGKKDICDIYGVFYETNGYSETLTGHDVLDTSNPRIISIARVDNAIETDEWIEFDEEFKLLPGRTVDPIKLKEGGYNIAIVFSSSIRGDHFEGAPGSTLYIDEVELGYEEKK